MKDFNNCDKRYIVASEAWYADSALSIRDRTVEDIIFGYYHRKGGTPGEMSMIWQQLGSGVSPYLKCHDDGFAALATFKDVINAIAELDDKNMTPQQFREILDSCGFADKTDRGPRYVDGSISELPDKQALLSMPE